MYIRKFKYFIALISLLLPLKAFSVNYIGTDNVLSLGGVNGVFIAIEGIDEHAVRSGLSVSGLMNEVESVLSKIGIKTLSEEEMLNTPGRPMLFVSVNAFRNYKDTSYSTEVSFNQIVILQRNAKVLAHLPTWSIKSSGMASNYEAGHEIQKYIKLSLEEFAKSYKQSK